MTLQSHVFQIVPIKLLVNVLNQFRNQTSAVFLTFQLGRWQKFGKTVSNSMCSVYGFIFYVKRVENLPSLTNPNNQK